MVGLRVRVSVRDGARIVIWMCLRLHLSYSPNTSLNLSFVLVVVLVLGIC
jgi:hypothetical protein